MNTVNIGQITAITAFVEDLPATRRFYTDVFGLQVHWEDEVSCVFRFGATLLNLLSASEGPGLIGPAEVASPEAGTRFQFTLDVDDVDAAAATLVERGATLLNGPLDRDWGIRTAAFRDPAGIVWELAAPLG